MKISNGPRTATNLASNNDGVKLSYIRTISNNHIIGSNKSCFHEKSNSIKSRFQKIIKKLDCFNVEKRGI